MISRRRRRKTVSRRLDDCAITVEKQFQNENQNKKTWFEVSWRRIWDGEDAVERDRGVAWCWCHGALGFEFGFHGGIGFQPVTRFDWDGRMERVNRLRMEERGFMIEFEFHGWEGFDWEWRGEKGNWNVKRVSRVSLRRENGKWIFFLNGW